MELSAFSTRGLTQPKTMKLQGRVGEKTMLILIGSGASHNFIGRGLVEELGLPVEGRLMLSGKSAWIPKLIGEFHMSSTEGL